MLENWKTFLKTLSNGALLNYIFYFENVPSGNGRCLATYCREILQYRGERAYPFSQTVYCASLEA